MQVAIQRKTMILSKYVYYLTTNMSILKSSILERVLLSENRWRKARNPAALTSLAVETRGSIRLQKEKEVIY